MSKAHCSAINCSNRQCKRPDLSFFRFPKNEERCLQWILNIRRLDLLEQTTVYVSNNCRLCSEHFELGQFSNKQTRNRLIWNAVPRQFIPPTKHTPLIRRLKRKPEDMVFPNAQKKQKVAIMGILNDHSYSRCLARINMERPTRPRGTLLQSSQSSRDEPNS